MKNNDNGEETKKGNKEGLFCLCLWPWALTGVRGALELPYSSLDQSWLVIVTSKAAVRHSLGITEWLSGSYRYLSLP